MLCLIFLREKPEVVGSVDGGGGIGNVEFFVNVARVDGHGFGTNAKLIGYHFFRETFSNQF